MMMENVAATAATGNAMLGVLRRQALLRWTV